VADVIHGPLVPFKLAAPRTRADYLAALLAQRRLPGNPRTWQCNVCGERIAGDEVLISYDVPAPIPYCTTTTNRDRSCAGYGPSLVPVPAG